MDFKGTALPLTRAGLDNATRLVGSGPAELWAVVNVETSGCGFFADRRPQTLFERHIFHQQTCGIFDKIHPAISNKEPGGYLGGMLEYARVDTAFQLSAVAALNSASWGIGQVMGFNATAVGYQNAAELVRAACESEDLQLEAMVRFMLSTGLEKALRKHDWATFARGYNGPSYADRNYHGKLEMAFGTFSKQLPDIQVRALQVGLMFCRMDPGPIDGLMGGKTRTAMHRFQQANRMQLTASVNEETLKKILDSTA